MLFPNTYPSSALGQPDLPRVTVREDSKDLDPEQGLLHMEEAEEEDEEPVFMLMNEGTGERARRHRWPGVGRAPRWRRGR